MRRVPQIAKGFSRFGAAVIFRGMIRCAAAAVPGVIALVSSLVPSTAMSYRLIDADLPNCHGGCPKIIVASGTILQNEHLNFAVFVRDAAATQRISKVMLVESNGGFLGGAGAVGALVRKLKMIVVVGHPTGNVVTRDSGLTSATCASACVLVLAGGTARYFVRGSRIGVHRSHRGTAVLDPLTKTVLNGTIQHDEIRNAYARFFSKMGISPALSTLIDKTPTESVHWLTETELAGFRLARDVSTMR
jgi:hypothetical protein